MKKGILVLVGVLAAGVSFAEFNKFEGVGARSLGMGGAFTAISDDASSLYYNPAGLLQVKDREEMYMYSSKLNELVYQYVGLVWKDTGFFYLNQQGKLTKADYQYGKEAGESIYGISYAKKINGKIGCGGSIKILHYENEREADSGFGCDVGILYSPEIKEDLSLGLMLRNLGAKINDVKIEEELRAGIVIRLNPAGFWNGLRNGGFMKAYEGGFKRSSFFDEPFPLLISCDLYNKKDNRDKNKIGWALGGEFKAFDILFVRLGLNNKKIGGGIGLAHDKWRLDYAYRYEGKDWIKAVDNHYVSLSMSF